MLTTVSLAPAPTARGGLAFASAELQRNTERLLARHDHTAQFATLDTLLRLDRAIAENGVTPGLLAFADPEHALAALLNTPGLEALADANGSEGLRSALKEAVARVADALTGRAAEIADADLVKFKGWVGRAMAAHRQYNIGLLKVVQGKAFTAKHLTTPIDWEGMWTAPGMQAVLQSIGKTPTVMAQLCKVPVPTTRDGFTGYVAALNKALAPFDKDWALTVTPSGVHYLRDALSRGPTLGWNAQPQAADERNLTVKEYGYTSSTTVATLIQTAAKVTDRAGAAADVLVTTLHQLTAQGQKLAASDKAAAATVRRCAGLLMRVGVKLITEYQFYKADDCTRRCAVILDATLGGVEFD